MHCRCSEHGSYSSRIGPSSERAPRLPRELAVQRTPSCPLPATFIGARGSQVWISRGPSVHPALSTATAAVGPQAECLPHSSGSVEKLRLPLLLSHSKFPVLAPAPAPPHTGETPLPSRPVAGPTSRLFVE